MTFNPLSSRRWQGRILDRKGDKLMLLFRKLEIHRRIVISLELEIAIILVVITTTVITGETSETNSIENPGFDIQRSVID